MKYDLYKVLYSIVSMEKLIKSTPNRSLQGRGFRVSILCEVGNPPQKQEVVY